MGCIVKLYDEYTIPDYDYSYLYHNEFASRFSIWVLLLLFSFILSRFICSYKSWIAACLCFKNIFPKQLVADFELLYYAPFIPFEFSGGFDFFFAFIRQWNFFGTLFKMIEFFCAYELKSGRNGWKSFTKFPLTYYVTCDCGRCDMWNEKHYRRCLSIWIWNCDVDPI